jgi:hypothetical protein
MDVRMERNYSFTKSFASIYVDIMDTFYGMLHESVDTCLSMSDIITSQPEMKHVLTTYKEQFTKLQPTTTAHVVGIVSPNSLCDSTFYDKDNFCQLTSWIPASFFHATENDQIFELFQQNPFHMQFKCASMSHGRQIHCRINNHNQLGKYQKIASLPSDMIDDERFVIMSWKQLYEFNYAPVDFYFQKLVDASESREAYQPMPYRLGNPTLVLISRDSVGMEQSNMSKVSGRDITSPGFGIIWDVLPIALSSYNNNIQIPPLVYLHMTEKRVRWVASKGSVDSTNIGLLRPSEIFIERGCLILKWAKDTTLNHQFTELKFYNSGGIAETVTFWLCDKYERSYFPPDRITDSHSYHLFPWFNDVYNRMDIFSCGLCPHTASICGRDYAIVMRFCFAKTSQDISNPLPPPQERQFHIQVDSDEFYFDVCKKYPAYFQLVPLD